MKRLAKYEALLWPGATVGRTIYAVVGVVPNDHDPLIGVMDTKALADAAVHAHNLEMVKKTADRVPRDP